MNRARYVKKLFLKEDIEIGDKSHKKAGRGNRKKVFRALRKAINRMLNKQDAE